MFSYHENNKSYLFRFEEVMRGSEILTRLYIETTIFYAGYNFATNSFSVYIINNKIDWRDMLDDEYWISKKAQKYAEKLVKNRAFL